MRPTLLILAALALAQATATSSATVSATIVDGSSVDAASFREWELELPDGGVTFVREVRRELVQLPDGGVIVSIKVVPVRVQHNE